MLHKWPKSRSRQSSSESQLFIDALDHADLEHSSGRGHCTMYHVVPSEAPIAPAIVSKTTNYRGDVWRLPLLGHKMATAGCIILISAVGNCQSGCIMRTWLQPERAIVRLTTDGSILHNLRFLCACLSYAGKLTMRAGCNALRERRFGGSGKGQRAGAGETMRSVGKSRTTNNVVTWFAKSLMICLYGATGKLSEKHIGFLMKAVEAPSYCLATKLKPGW